MTANAYMSTDEGFYTTISTTTIYGSHSYKVPHGPVTWRGISLLDLGEALNLWKNQNPLIRWPKGYISLRKNPIIGGKF